MLVLARRLLSFEMTIAEWIGTAVMLAVPHVALGVVWTAANLERFDALHGLRLVLGLIGSVLAWPVMLLPGMCAA